MKSRNSNHIRTVSSYDSLDFQVLDINRDKNVDNSIYQCKRLIIRLKIQNENLKYLNHSVQMKKVRENPYYPKYLDDLDRDKRIRNIERNLESLTKSIHSSSYLFSNISNPTYQPHPSIYHSKGGDNFEAELSNITDKKSHNLNSPKNTDSESYLSVHSISPLVNNEDFISPSDSQKKSSSSSSLSFVENDLKNFSDQISLKNTPKQYEPNINDFTELDYDYNYKFSQSFFEYFIKMSF